MNELKWTAIFSMIGAATIHGIAVPHHFEEWPSAGLFFLAMTVGQMFSAVFIAAGLPAVFIAAGLRRSYLGVIVFNVGILVVYVVSRTFGLPFGEVEAIRTPDLIATVFEVVAIAALVPFVVKRGSHTSMGW